MFWSSEYKTHVAVNAALHMHSFSSAVKVQVSYLTWVVDESPKAYVQPSPRQVLYLPSIQSRLVLLQTVPN